MLVQRVKAGEGILAVELLVVSTGGNGLCAALMGGQQPHVGGSVVGIPRAKTSEPGLTCDISQICVPGHKDVIAGAQVTRLLAQATGQTVSLTCGVHVDDADAQTITQLVNNCRDAAHAWIERFGNEETR